jgi:hypothetical protein
LVDETLPEFELDRLLDGRDFLGELDVRDAGCFPVD